VFALAEDRPELSLEVVATNPRDRAAELRLRPHLEMNLGGLAQTEVAFSDRQGTARRLALPAIIEGHREGVHLRDRAAPAGEWTFTGTKGLRVRQQWDDRHLDFAWLYAYPEDLGQLDAELWLKRRQLDPGETMRFSQTITIEPTRP
jgi:hypothetical protein